jgi:hypothetical protein
MSQTKTIRAAKRDLSVIEAELHTALKSEIANKIKVGGLLVEAKEAVRHGEWLPWLERNFALSERSAQHYMVAFKFAAKYECGADLKLRLNAIYELEKSDEETVGAVLQLAKTEWLNGEVVARVAEAFRRSKNAAFENEECEAERRSEEQVEAIVAAQAEATIKQEAEARAEAETILDAAPPELPLTAARAPRLRDEFLTSAFQRAIKMLKDMMTKPAAKFVRADYSATDLELVANFLNQVAAAKQRVV